MKKVLLLIKKAWYYAWHRHHLLIPFPVLKSYIKSFFRLIKKSGGISADIFTSPKDYKKYREANKLTKLKTKENNLTIIYFLLNNNTNQIIKVLNSLKDIKGNNKIILATYNSNKSIINISDVDVYFYNKDDYYASIYNDLIKKIKTQYVIFINSNILLEKESLSYINKYINDTDADILYSDEDHINKKDILCYPLFKPIFAVDSYLGYNYFGNMVVIKKDVIDKTGKLSNKYNNYCFDDYILKCIDNSNNIVRIPYILFHDYLENKVPLSIQKEILTAYLKRNKIKSNLEVDKKNNQCIIKYLHNNPLVSIIIPFKDQYKLLKNCIDDLLNKNTYKNYELILIDNGSTDIKLLNWLEDIKKDYHQIKIYHNPMEFNFSKLCNYGVKHSKGDYCLLLNNDTRIIDNDFLDWMVGYAQRKDVGAVGLKLLYNDRRVQHMGVNICDGFASHYGAMTCESTKGHFNMRIRPYNFSAVTGACLLVRKDKYKEVKGLDENLPIALNDIDFCLKLLDKGYLNVCLNNKKMYHFESKSRGYDRTKEKQERFNKERNYVIDKWKEKFQTDDYFNKNFFS